MRLLQLRNYAPFGDRDNHGDDDDDDVLCNLPWTTALRGQRLVVVLVRGGGGGGGDRDDDDEAVVRAAWTAKKTSNDVFFPDCELADVWSVGSVDNALDFAVDDGSA